MTGEGVDRLREGLRSLAREAEATAPARQPYVVLRPARAAFVVRREGERFRVVGRNVERWVAEADLEDPREVAALQKRLVRAGVERALEDEGATVGDEIVIGSAAFDFRPGASIDDALRAALEDDEDDDGERPTEAPVGRREDLLRREAEGGRASSARRPT